jgi:hypothetical protein
MQYPVAPSTDGLSTAAKGGIGAGVAVAGIGIFALVFFLIRMIRKRKHDKAVIANLQGVSAGTVVVSGQNPESMQQIQHEQMYQPSPGQYSAQVNQDPRQVLAPTMGSYSPPPAGFSQAPPYPYGALPNTMAAGAGAYFAPNEGNSPHQQYNQAHPQQYESWRASDTSAGSLSQPSLPSPGNGSMVGSTGYSPSHDSSQQMRVQSHEMLVPQQGNAPGNSPTSQQHP